MRCGPLVFLIAGGCVFFHDPPQAGGNTSAGGTDASSTTTTGGAGSGASGGNGGSGGSGGSGGTGLGGTGGQGGCAGPTPCAVGCDQQAVLSADPTRLVVYDNLQGEPQIAIAYASGTPASLRWGSITDFSLEADPPNTRSVGDAVGLLVRTDDARLFYSPACAMSCEEALAPPAEGYDILVGTPIEAATAVTLSQAEHFAVALSPSGVPSVQLFPVDAQWSLADLTFGASIDLEPIGEVKRTRKLLAHPDAVDRLWILAETQGSAPLYLYQGTILTQLHTGPVNDVVVSRGPCGGEHRTYALVASTNPLSIQWLIGDAAAGPWNQGPYVAGAEQIEADEHFVYVRKSDRIEIFDAASLNETSSPSASIMTPATLMDASDPTYLVFTTKLPTGGQLTRWKKLQ